MTNAELLAKIKAEIERQQKENVNYDENGSFASYCDSTTWSVLDSILTFVSGIEKSEKPMNQDGLKEEIESYWKENGPMSHAEYDRLAKCARHFAKWGAEHLADARKISPNDLEEAAKYKLEDYDAVAYMGDMEEGQSPLYDMQQMLAMFIAGAKWQKQHDAELIEIAYNDGITIGMTKQKEQMMKEVVEIRVQTSPLHGPLGISAYCCNFPSEHPFYHCKEGDKVRVIVLPKED